MSTEGVSAAPSYDVFISYSRKDQAFAAKLEAALERYRPPKGISFPRRRLRVLRDEDDFTGTEYHAALRQHLHTSAKLLVICSPAARQSRYVDDEIRQFAAIRGPEHIVPVLIAGTPNNEARVDQDQDLAFPQALSDTLAFPLAADFRGFDLREHKFGGRTGEVAWYSALANICGVSREDLEQRERTRRRDRLVRILAVTAAIAGSMVIALAQSRNVAREQSRSLAELARTASGIGLFRASAAHRGPVVASRPAL